MSVAQADKVIIALPGEKSKMSIYEKIAISWRSALPFPDSADRMRGGDECSARDTRVGVRAVHVQHVHILFICNCAQRHNFNL